MTDERLQELYQRALAGTGAGSGEHASPEAIQALVEREGSEAERLATLDHVMSCGACRQDYDLLRAVRSAGERSGGVGRTAARPAMATWRTLALAASVVLAIGAGLWFQRDAGSDEFRGDGDGIVLVAPDATVGGADMVRLAWRPLPGAERYRIEVLDSADAVVFSATGGDTVVSVPVGRLPAGAYTWWVTADRAGAAQARSSFGRLRIE
jgi:hypothetical protein